MTDRSDEDIVAYLDGEMPDEARRAFEAQMKDDPALAEAVTRHREVLSQLHRAYPAGTDKRFDNRELAALGLLDGARPIDFAQAR